MSFSIGSLFDGSGGFPLAATLCGGTPKWASEVEPYPIAVTRSRFPRMQHLGDVSKISGAGLEPVDVVTFGSPCQDLSVAGKREGLKHESNGDEETTRSGLFMEAVRIIKEMRGATNGVYPNYALWENVPGAFSSNRGEDFRIILQELIKIVEPEAVMPPVPKGGWPYSDCYCGDGWSLAYRVFDAQHWGVPQRRRRIYLVLDLRGDRAGEILFTRQGLQGHFDAGGSSGESVASDIGNCAETADRAVEQYVFRKGTRPHTKDDAQKWEKAEIANTLNVFDRGEVRANELVVEKKEPGAQFVVRRLTPAEYARLQGFPGRWGAIDHKDDFTDDEYHFWRTVRNTHAAINGRPVKEYSKKQMRGWYNRLHSDSAEYRMWGNGIALPTALYCMQGIAESIETEGK